MHVVFFEMCFVSSDFMCDDDLVSLNFGVRTAWRKAHGRGQEFVLEGTFLGAKIRGQKPRVGRCSRGPARGLRERCKLPQRGSGQSPDLKCISDALRDQKTRLQMSRSSRFLIRCSFWCSGNLRFLGGAIAP